MDIIQDIKPLSTFKQNAAQIIAQIKQTKRPAIITINGNAEVVIQDAQSYQEMVDSLEYLKNVKKIGFALREVENGKTVSAKEGFSQFSKKHGL